MSPPPKRGNNEAIAGLRGLAAAVVVVYHEYAMCVDRGLLPALPNVWWSAMLSRSALVSVCLFFCISGYLITASLLRHGNVREFAANRVARIMPVFGILHLVMFTVGVMANYEWMGSLRRSPAAYVGHFFSNLFFLPGVFNLPLAQKNAWTLSYEALFYVLAAAAFVAWSRKSWLGATLAGVVLAVTVAFLGFRPFSAYFLVGIGAFALDRRGKLQGLHRVPKWLGVLALFLGWYAFSVHPLLGILPLAAAFVTLVGRSGWLSDLLRRPSFQQLGLWSYSLYIVHPFVLDPLRTLTVRLLAPRLGNVPAAAVFWVVGFCASVFIARWSYELVEQRLTKALFPKLSDSQRRKAAAQPG